jgi:hypothetical protein
MKFSDLITGKDNTTLDIARVSWLTTTAFLMFGWAYQALHNNVVVLMDFAQSIGIITGAHGAAVMLKKDTEPDK